MKRLKVLSVALGLVSGFVLGGCQTSTPQVNVDELEQPTVQQPEQLPIATIEIEDFGIIKAELYPHLAPNTVYNFIELANDGFYDGVIIHRIEPNFVLQMGDPTGMGNGGPGYRIKGEFKANGFNNELLHTKGVLSMARTAEYDSAGSQFFIMLEDAPHLDGAYASFGKVIEGIEVADAIEGVTTIAGVSKPVEDVVITKVSVDTFGQTYEAPVILN